MRRNTPYMYMLTQTVWVFMPEQSRTERPSQTYVKDILTRQQKTNACQTRGTCHFIKPAAKTWACVHACVSSEHESCEVTIIKNFLLDISVFCPRCASCRAADRSRNSRSFLAWFLPSGPRGSSPKRPAELVNAMITSNSGCDLRPPVDTYAFKCEAKQSSLEVALTASRCAACAFIRGRRGFEAFFFLSLSTRFAVLPVPQVICWICVNFIYFRQHSDVIRI